MKLISLNIWGGKLEKALLNFICEQQKSVDIFCFQEVYNSSVRRLIAHDMVSTIYSDISKILPNHQGSFAPHIKNYDIKGKVNFDLLSGIAMFIRKTLAVSKISDIFLFRDRFDVLENKSYVSVPRNLQYVWVKQNCQEYLISHFHGVWFPKTKLDNPDRLEQSRRIIKFFSKNYGKKVLCGDFNLMPDTKSMKILESQMRNLITEYHIPTTRNKNYVRSEKYADYILVSKNIKVNDFRVLDIEVSDHLPLYLDYD